MEFAFADLYENMILEKAASILRNNGSGLAKVEPQGANSKPESLENELSRKRNEGNSIKVDSQAVDPKGEILNPAISNNPLKYVAYGSLLVLLVTGFLFWRFRNKLRPVPMQNQGKPIINESIPELPALGKFLFNVKGQRLLISDEVISLTDKECKVLELLHNNFGELIPRETLMQEVWINEGVITGRSLDMFVSKLRKKLSRDPELRITNIHGKGYKLEIPERQVI
jgi:DNA-binding winged helix-turn-helix (wHTH) protein